MAVDEVLLESAVVEGTPSLRTYGWTPATLSLGYFQSVAERDAHSASSAAPLVRRASGGGAILHDHELTYSLALPADHPAVRRPERVYDLVHGSLITWFAQRGIAAVSCEPVAEVQHSAEPFLCFERRAVGDLLVDGWKIVGSAQRRHRGAVLQHGSILLHKSDFAPELPGVIDLCGTINNATELAEDLAADWLPRAATALGLELRPSELSTAEQRAAENGAREKFAHQRWNAKR